MVSLIVSTAFGQKIDEYLVGQNESPKFIKFNTRDKASIQTDERSVLKEYVYTQQSDEIVELRKNTDNSGFTHTKYQQYYKGVKVEHGVFTVNSKEGAIYSLNGDYVRIPSTISTSATLSETTALASAMKFIGAQTYMWQSAENQKWAAANEDAGTFYPKGELVYVRDYKSSDKLKKFAPRLAYKFNVYASQPLSRDFIYVDAETGAVLHSNAIIKKCFNTSHDHSAEHSHVVEPIVEQGTKKLVSILANTTASAETRYAGTRTIVADSYNGSYRLRETTRGNGIETYDMNTGTNYNSAVDFTDNDNNWTAAEFDNAAKDDAALDAHWGAEMTYDYWSTEHNRNSFDGNGAAIKSYVHFDNAYDNAYWNGSVMTYGDGSDTYFDALTSLDVAAHEIGHAVCSYTADLAYQNESGAMNEGFSDIWAACVEYYAAPEKDIWLIGEDIERRTTSVSLRSMSDPKAEGQPDTYFGTNWAPLASSPSSSNDYGGVHTNSGVMNHWFYILSVGATSSNDNGDAYSVTGLTIDVAAKIAYRIESVYLSANSTYADARSFSIQAAEDLYGAGSNEVIQTTNAWYAVGVGAEYGNIAYCASKGNNSSYEWIAEVAIGTFTNTSGAAGYTNFTAQTVDLVAGDSYGVTLTPGFASTVYNEYWKIWIDYNADGDFSDAGELAFDGGALTNTIETGSMTVASVAAVTTRMRVSMKYNAAQTECEAFDYGEVEDYTVNITAGGGGDTSAPSVPASLSASNVTETTLDLSWTASTDNVGVTGYDIYQNGSLLGSTTGAAASITGLTASTSYSYYVKAKDAAGNVSGASNTVNVTTATGADTQAPTAPASLSSSNVTETTLDLSWNAASDNVAVTGYDIYQNGSLLGSSTGTSAAITGLTAATSYSYYVKAKDAAGNVSSASNTVNVTTATPADTQAPSTPSSLVASAITETSLSLSWTASSDNIGVTGYDVYKDGAYFSTVGSASTSITGLTASTSYSFYVKAKDAAGNISAASNTVNATTLTPSTGGDMPTGYCASKGTNSSYEWIDLVQLGSINNVTGNDGGYADYTSMSTSIATGSSQTVYISAGFSGSSYTEFWQVWIDYNRDGDFTDAGELVVSGSSSSSATLSGTFTVPATASIGTTRMRVTMKYNSSATSCESTFAYGEVEDYAVNISSAGFAFANNFNSLSADELGNEEASYSIYPIPAKDFITVPANAENDILITIYNATGAIVRKEMLTNNSVNVSELDGGVYLMSINDGNKTTEKRFIKQ